MAIKLTQDLKQTQNLMMTPQLRQAIELLTVPHLEMTQIISKELIENPLLEEIDTEILKGETPANDSDYHIENLEMQNHEDHDATGSNPSTSDTRYGTDGDHDSFQEYDQNSYSDNSYLDSQSDHLKAKSMVGPLNPDEVPNYENIVSKEQTLQDYLEWQLRMDYLSAKDEEIATIIIHNLNDDGLLEMTLEEIMEKANASSEEVNKILFKIQHLDPLGCATSSLQECLLVQARILYGDCPTLELLLSKYLSHIDDKNFYALLKKEGQSKEQVDNALDLLKELHPRPGRPITPSETHYVVPDIFISLVGNEIIISMNDEGVPKLKISNYYTSLLKNISGASKQEETAKEYVKDKLRSASWLIKSIGIRQKTIYRVAEAIVKLQPDFFKKGPNYLRPMILKDIASEIGMHESTVSRVTVNKYMHTHLGTFELKYFFNAGIGGKDGGTDVASETLKKKIKTMIGLEDAKRPLSDQKIVEILEREGIIIARRTVAKYRELMDILPSARRKQRR
ncbi:MAG: RNA polymerase factor sigma-54 [Oligoflexia bacterium]|nr:RNA polymerase factor sigma-54 [Oligoflexia bacterium]